MAKITLGGNPINTIGNLPAVGSKAPDFSLSAIDLSTVGLEKFTGKKKILNIFPSVDTGVCAASVRKFNVNAAAYSDAVVLCISRDLPFAQKRFCGAEGIENVFMLSDFKSGTFGKEYGVEITDGNFSGLHARAVVVLDAENNIIYEELVPEIAQEPNYEAALAVL